MIFLRSKRIYLLLTLIFSSCISESDRIEEYLKELNIEKGTVKSIVIIPFGGCSSCIDEAFRFLENNATNQEIQFVISNVNNKRLIRLRLTKMSVIQNSNVIIDDSSSHLNFGLNTMYPYIIYTTESGSLDYRLVDPYNSHEWSLLKEAM